MRFTTKFDNEHRAKFYGMTMPEHNKLANDFADKLVTKIHDEFGKTSHVTVLMTGDAVIWNVEPSGLLPQIKLLAKKITNDFD